MSLLINPQTPPSGTFSVDNLVSPVEPSASSIPITFKLSLETNSSCSTLIVDTEMSHRQESIFDAPAPSKHPDIVLEQSASHATCIESSVTFAESSSQHMSEIVLDEMFSSSSTSSHVPSPSKHALTIDTTGRTRTPPRQGISRYSPYGTRFAALMEDGVYRTSHVAGDLADRAVLKGGKGGRVDLVLVCHEGEKKQLDSALAFYKLGEQPGPSEVLKHLKDVGLDWDYRKGDDVKLMQRNASNFFKRMTEHAKRENEIAGNEWLDMLPTPPQSARVIESEEEVAAAILQSLMAAPVSTPIYDDEFMADFEVEDEEMQVENVDIQAETGSEGDTESQKRKIDWSLPRHHEGSFYYEVCRHGAKVGKEESALYSQAAELFDWTTTENTSVRPLYNVRDSDRWTRDVDDQDSTFVPVVKRRKTKHQLVTPKPPRQMPKTPRPTPKAFSSSGSVPSTAAPVIRKGREGLTSGNFLKGLSRHSPYGTRFAAQMPSGEMRESYLAGDLADRIRSGSGKGQGELLLVLHGGEIAQLQAAWDYVQSQEQNQIGAGVVLEQLRQLGLDVNHRKPGCNLLQKNAGNFFKRVQEYGRRKAADPTYLSSLI